MSRKERTPYIDALRVISNAPPAGAAPAQEQKPSVDNRILEEEVRLARIENDIREKDQALKEQTLRWLFILLGIESGHFQIDPKNFRLFCHTPTILLFLLREQMPDSDCQHTDRLH